MQVLLTLIPWSGVILLFPLAIYALRRAREKNDISVLKLAFFLILADTAYVSAFLSVITPPDSVVAQFSVVFPALCVLGMFSLLLDIVVSTTMRFKRALMPVRLLMAFFFLGGTIAYGLGGIPSPQQASAWGVSISVVPRGTIGEIIFATGALMLTVLTATAWWLIANALEDSHARTRTQLFSIAWFVAVIAEALFFVGPQLATAGGAVIFFKAAGTGVGLLGPVFVGFAFLLKHQQS